MFGRHKARDEVKKLRQGQSWTCFCFSSGANGEVGEGVLTHIGGETCMSQKRLGVLARYAVA